MWPKEEIYSLKLWICIEDSWLKICRKLQIFCSDLNLNSMQCRIEQAKKKEIHLKKGRKKLKLTGKWGNDIYTSNFNHVYFWTIRFSSIFRSSNVNKGNNRCLVSVYSTGSHTFTHRSKSVYEYIPVCSDRRNVNNEYACWFSLCL